MTLLNDPEMVYDLTISIVLFNSDLDKLKNAIDSVYRTTLNFKLYLVDNSPTDVLKKLKRDERTSYIFNGANLGFGKAHNVALERSQAESKYHLVLNPDIFFDAGVLEGLFTFMEANPQAGHVMPKVLYPNGGIQHLCKLLPTPLDFFLRRFFPWFPGAARRNRRFELIDSGYDKIMNVPFLSGCFMFLRNSVMREVGFFDDRIFMYVEDADLTRRIHKRHETLFYPHVSVHHHYHKGSYKNLKLMFYNIHGAIVYFTKWGWFFDAERKKINRQTLRSYILSR